MPTKEIDRKIAVIFATDVVNYSKHMETDESETVKSLRFYEKILKGLFKKYNGNLFNSGGDSFMAEFVSAVDAVECAVEFQKVIKTSNLSSSTEVALEFRIGINTGDVIKEKGNLLGEGVNIAARLEALALAGGISVSKSVFDYVKGKTKHQFNDLGIQKVKQNEFHAFDIVLDPSEKRSLRPKQSKGLIRILALGVLVLVIGVFSFYLSDDTELKNAEQIIAESDRPMLLVMPFENRSGNKSDDQLSSGMTDVIISSLASHPRLLVQSSSTSNFIKKKGMSDQEIKNEYYVNYILRGYNQVSGEKIRTTIELSDVVKNKIVWTDKFDFKLNDIFEIQDTISEKVLEKLQIKLTLGTSFDDDRKYFKDPENWQRFLKANSLWLSMSLEGVKEAGKLFDEIFKSEPNNPVVLSMYAWYFTAQASVGLRDWSINKDMVDTAKLAVDNGPDLSDANSLLATLMAKNPKEFPEYSQNELLDAARHFAKKASDLNPKGIISILSAANSLFIVGLYDQAVQNYEKALKVAPHPPGNVKLNYALALTYLEQYDKAYKLAAELSENEQYFGGSQIGALGIRAFIDMVENRSSDAKKLTERIFEIDSSINFKKLRRSMKTFIIMDRSFMEKLSTTLEKAGIDS
ncbi:adenylate/guanylate cyclase domain-containing protein [Paracoccaceae bacterium]|nr:adenylate/guanylate cyclase domain-containing protein [Paracoccaceae bacterium]